MGLREYQENSESIRIANQTELPLVYVISQVGVLYRGIIQPGERVIRLTGRVWFTVTCYPYDGTNLPTDKDVILPIFIWIGAAIALAATAGTAALAAAPAVGTAQVIFAGTATAASVNGAAAAIAAGPAVYGGAQAAQSALVGDLERTLNAVVLKGHYANGDWLHVRGGPREGVVHSAWEPLRFER